MAIARFHQTATSDLTQFVNWLNENKEGTFLEDVTITYDSAASNVITFSTQDASVVLTFTTAAGSSQEVVRYTTNDTYWTLKTTSATTATALLEGAVLCSNGLLFDFYGKTAASSLNHGYTVALTLDSNGEIAALFTGDTVIASSDFTSWGVLAGGSSSIMSRTIEPYYGANRICLSPIAAQANDAGAYLPEAYAAISTTVSGMGLDSIFVDGTPFITNGMWYIRDDGE